jgi:drug/metabolite transporter (DMT)-like permease
VLVIVRPGPEGLNLYALLALAVAAMVAARDIATRFVPAEVPTTIVALSTTSGVGLAGLVVGFAEAWPPLPARELAYVASAAVLVTLGNLAVIVAFRGTDVSVVSPFRYSVILWAILSGLVIFGDWPDPVAFIGIALIVGSGVYMIHREQARQRDALRASAAAGTAA